MGPLKLPGQTRVTRAPSDGSGGSMGDRSSARRADFEKEHHGESKVSCGNGMTTQQSVVGRR